MCILLNLPDSISNSFGLVERDYSSRHAAVSSCDRCSSPLRLVCTHQCSLTSRKTQRYLLSIAVGHFKVEILFAR